MEDGEEEVVAVLSIEEPSGAATTRARRSRWTGGPGGNQTVMTRFLPVLLAVAAGSGAGRAEVVTRPVAYHHGSTALEGLLVFDPAGTGKRPGILLAYEHG